MWSVSWASHGSPSCGVNHTLDTKRSLELIGRLPETANVENMNQIVLSCQEAGEGLFVRLLRKELKRQKLDVPFLAHDMRAEIQGTIVPLEFPRSTKSRRTMG